MKMKDFGFRRGVNLGGWFSQCDYSQERLDRFITEKDLDIIAGWGLDHVRVPMDYNILETEDGQFSAEGFERIRRVTEQCRERGLRVVLDLHKTAGFSFDKDEQEEGFFTSAAYQERFWNLWDELSKAFYAPDRIAFEMLNEVTDEAWSSAWNKIAAECIRRIRKNAPDSVITSSVCVRLKFPQVSARASAATRRRKMQAIRSLRSATDGRLMKSLPPSKTADCSRF